MVASGQAERKKGPAEKVLTGVAGGAGFAASHIPFAGPTLGKIIGTGGETAIELYYNAKMIHAGERIKVLYQGRGLRGIVDFSDEFSKSLMDKLPQRVGWIDLESMKKFADMLTEKINLVVKSGAVVSLPADTHTSTFIATLLPSVLEASKDSPLILKTDLGLSFPVNVLFSTALTEASAFAKLRDLAGRTDNQKKIGTFFKVVGENLDTLQKGTDFVTKRF